MARTVADKLNHLFQIVIPAGGTGYTNAEVATKTGLSSSYIAYLRSGERDNPTMQTLEVLAKFFGVPTAYFYDDEATDRVEEQLRQLRALADLHQALQRDGVKELAMRMGELSEGGIAAISQLVDLLLQKERGSNERAGGSDGGT